MADDKLKTWRALADTSMNYIAGDVDAAADLIKRNQHLFEASQQVENEWSQKAQEREAERQTALAREAPLIREQRLAEFRRQRDRLRAQLEDVEDRLARMEKQ